MTTRFTLTSDQREQFLAEGLIRIQGAVSPDTIEPMLERIWRALAGKYGALRDQPQTWPHGVREPVDALKQMGRAGVFAGILSPTVRELLDDFFGNCGWEQAYAALGYAHYAQRKVPEGVEALKKALELEPKNSNALNSLGFIYAEEKIDLPRAVSLCRQAVEVAPRNAAYLDSLGWAYFRLGNLEEARACFRRALDQAPGNKEIAAHMRVLVDALKSAASP